MLTIQYRNADLARYSTRICTTLQQNTLRVHVALRARYITSRNTPVTYSVTFHISSVHKSHALSIRRCQKNSTQLRRRFLLNLQSVEGTIASLYGIAPVIACGRARVSRLLQRVRGSSDGLWCVGCGRRSVGGVATPLSGRLRARRGGKH